MLWGGQSDIIWAESRGADFPYTARTVSDSVHAQGAGAAAAPAKRDRSQLLLEINAAIVSHASLTDLLRAVSACLKREVTHDFAALVLYHEETYELRAHALEFSGCEVPNVEGVPVSMEGSVAGLAFTSRKPVLRHRLDPEEFHAEVQNQIIACGITSACAVPLIFHGRILGSLSVASFREGAFTEEDAEMLLQIGSQFALAVENSRNFDMLRSARSQVVKSRDRLKLLLDVNNALVANLEVSELLKAVSKSLKEVLHQDLVGLALYDAQRKLYLAHALDSSAADDDVMALGETHPLEGTLGGAAVRAGGKPVYIPRPDVEKFNAPITRRLYDRGYNSICVIGLFSHDRPVGILTLACFRENAFSSDDLELIQQIAQQVAIAGENALAYGEIEKLKNKLADEKLYLEDEIRTEYDFEEIVGRSTALRQILKQVATVAATGSTVLIRGETGTGKELIARAIHNMSDRKERTMVKVNCSAIPMGLLESELFGHEKGAFTGAIAQRIGRFELANRGTLFLDEVGDIPLELQPKLLRVLQEQQFERLGSTRTQQVDVRLVAATNCDLETMVAAKQYRSDLYYRLNVFPVTIPPLRERAEDIPLLVRFFAQRFARRMGKNIDSIPASTTSALSRYHWPGNVRELENVIERAVILSSGRELDVPLTGLKVAEVAAPASPATAGPAPTSLESVERDHIVRVLEDTKWRIAGPDGAAARLGMKRTTLQARMRKLGISRS
jgi:formate hydrogenlyase transcriptional activator